MCGREQCASCACGTNSGNWSRSQYNDMGETARPVTVAVAATLRLEFHLRCTSHAPHVELTGEVNFFKTDSFTAASP